MMKLQGYMYVYVVKDPIVQCLFKEQSNKLSQFKVADTKCT